MSKAANYFLHKYKIILIYMPFCWQKQFKQGWVYMKSGDEDKLFSNAPDLVRDFARVFVGGPRSREALGLDEPVDSAPPQDNTNENRSPSLHTLDLWAAEVRSVRREYAQRGETLTDADAGRFAAGRFAGSEGFHSAHRFFLDNQEAILSRLENPDFTVGGVGGPTVLGANPG